MTDKEEIIIDGANILKEKINMCFILLLNKLETTETIERTIYEYLDTFVDKWNDLFQRKTQECEKYEQVLDEIEKELKEDINCESQECGCDDFEECLKCTKEHILDIISKVKDGNNEQL